MTVDRLSLQPAIGCVTLLRAMLSSRRRITLFVVVTLALMAALVLSSGPLISLHIIGPQLSKLPRRLPLLAARLSFSLVGDRTANAIVADAKTDKADEKHQAMATSGQSTVAIAPLAWSTAGDGRTVSVHSTKATIHTATAGQDAPQRSSAADATSSSGSTAQLTNDVASSLSAAAAAAVAAAAYSAPQPSTVTLRISVTGGANLETNASAAPLLELTSLAALLGTRSVTGKQNELAATAASAATSAITAATRHTTTPRGSNTSSAIAARPNVYVRFIDPMAGIGNKMFQYAGGVGLAMRHGANARLVVDHPQITKILRAMRRVFRLSPLPEQPAAPSAAEAATLSESGWGRYDASRFDKRSSFEHGANIIGYLQSWRYFEPVASHIRSEFALTPLAASLADNFLRRSDAGGRAAEGNGSSTLFVGVHVRRGDMVSQPTLYTVAPPEFLLNAINHYVVKYGVAYQLTFVIATNDRDWVKSFVENRLPKSIRVLNVQFTAEEDMAVLSRCNHSIVTAGTFGWWSAWLAGGDVVYYKDFMRPGSPLYDGHVPSDYYPPHWLALS